MERVQIVFNRMVHDAPPGMSPAVFNDVMRLYARREDYAAVRFVYEQVRVGLEPFELRRGLISLSGPLGPLDQMERLEVVPDAYSRALLAHADEYDLARLRSPHRDLVPLTWNRGAHHRHATPGARRLATATLGLDADIRGAMPRPVLPAPVAATSPAVAAAEAAAAAAAAAAETAAGSDATARKTTTAPVGTAPAL